MVGHNINQFSDSSQKQSLLAEGRTPSELGRSSMAAAATSLIGFLCLVIAVFIGIPYMFFFFRAAGRWLLLGCCVFTLLGGNLHLKNHFLQIFCR